MTTWHDDLRAAVARGLAAEGPVAVGTELEAQYALLAEHPDAPVEPILPEVPVLAVAGCASGRLGILLDVDGRVSVHLARTTAVLLDQVRESTDPGVLAFTGDAEQEAATWSDVPTESVAAYDGEDDLADRREQLRRSGLVAPGWFSGSGFTEAQLLDACGAAVVAVRRQG